MYIGIVQKSRHAMSLHLYFDMLFLLYVAILALRLQPQLRYFTTLYTKKVMTMNHSQKLTITRACENLQTLLTLVDEYDLSRARKNPDVTPHLQALEDQVATYFTALDHPDTLPVFPFQNYDMYYACLNNLYHNPLTHVDIGIQEKVNSGYQAVILRALYHLQAFSI